MENQLFYYFVSGQNRDKTWLSFTISEKIRRQSYFNSGYASLFYGILQSF